MKLLIKLHRERYRKNDLMITHSYFKTMISSCIIFDFLAMEEKMEHCLYDLPTKS